MLTHDLFHENKTPSFCLSIHSFEAKRAHFQYEFMSQNQEQSKMENYESDDFDLLSCYDLPHFQFVLNNRDQNNSNLIQLYLK